MARANAGKAGLIALVGASAAALMTTTVGTWEGKSNDPYRDIVGVETVKTAYFIALLPAYQSR